MSRVAALLLVAVAGSAWAGPEVLQKVTGSSGACIEETLDVEETETLIISVACAGLRTSMVWLKDGSRINLMVCGEDAEAPGGLKKLRGQLQGQVKAWKTVTACVRDGRVQLVGWVEKEADKAKIAKLAEKYGEKVADKVEYVEE